MSVTLTQPELAGDVVVSVWAFSNGTAFMDWESRNCDRCRKTYDVDRGSSLCDLNDAIDDAASINDGYVSTEIAERLGWTESDVHHPNCKEFEPAPWLHQP